MLGACTNFAQRRQICSAIDAQKSKGIKTWLQGRGGKGKEINKRIKMFLYTCKFPTKNVNTMHYTHAEKIE